MCSVGSVQVSWPRGEGKESLWWQVSMFLLRLSWVVIKLSCKLKIVVGIHIPYNDQDPEGKIHTLLKTCEPVLKTCDPVL